MTIPSDDDDSPLGPLTDQERDFLEAYRELDDADQVFIWHFILTERSRRSAFDEEPSEGKELRP